MRYIRTKDGRIIETNDNLQIIYNTLCKEQNKRVWSVLGDILKEADTIEELCDGFVLRYRNDKDEYLIDRVDRLAFGMSKAQLDEHDFYIRVNGIKYSAVLYGGIWNEWGFKYIAKMNEKGEFELL